jgi:hypothetical protein
MAVLKIRIFRKDGATPDTTITVPLRVLEVASKIIPRKVKAVLDEHGIDINQIVELSQTEQPLGTLVEIEEHEKRRKFVIAVE